VDQANFSWPRWGQFYQTKGSAGEACDLVPAERLLDLYGAWMRADTDAEKSEAWRGMLAIHADQVFAIGTVSRAPVPVVAASNLRNVPDEAIYAWDPGAHMGVHRIDEFFFAPGPGQ
jgi:peptide/nickel transport system substrate-binding protein